MLYGKRFCGVLCRDCGVGFCDDLGADCGVTFLCPAWLCGDEAADDVAD